MNYYVCGFMFSPDESRVLLIQKKRPAWQAGKLNGIGGKRNVGETSPDAMVREFQEETGLTTVPEHWRLFCLLHGGEPGRPEEEFDVAFYFTHSNKIDGAKTTTDEAVFRIRVDNLREYDTLPNLPWLIPMALSPELQSGGRVACFEVEEQ